MYIYICICDTQAVALVLNAYAKMELHPRPLFEFLANVAAALPANTFNAQAVANIANALAKADLKHVVLLDKLGDLCLRMTAVVHTCTCMYMYVYIYTSIYIHVYVYMNRHT